MMKEYTPPYLFGASTNERDGILRSPPPSAFRFFEHYDPGNNSPPNGSDNDDEKAGIEMMPPPSPTPTTESSTHSTLGAMAIPPSLQLQIQGLVFRSRRNRYILILALVALLLISLIIGVTVGVTNGKKRSNNNDNNGRLGNTLTTTSPTMSPSALASSSSHAELWRLVGNSIVGDPVRDFRSGYSVSMSNDGQRIAITSYGLDTTNAGGTHRDGRVLVYQQNGTLWKQVENELLLSSVHAGGGQSQEQEQNILQCQLAGDGHSIVVMGSRFGLGGAPFGYAQVYEFSSRLFRGWNPRGNILISNSPLVVPTSVSINENGRIVAMGSALNNKVRVYQHNHTVNFWTHLGNVLEGEGPNDGFGASVALSNDGLTLAAGAPGADTVSSGSVRVFKFAPDGAWRQIGQTLHGQSPSDQAGSTALSGSGNIVAVGAAKSQDGAGQVRVYQLSSSSGVWSQLGQELEGEERGDLAGSRLELSVDGRVVAVAASSNRNGAGHVRVYAYNDDDALWVQRGDDLDGPNANDSFGSDIGLSADGNRLVVGAPQDHDANGRVNTAPARGKPGYANVYQLESRL